MGNVPHIDHHRPRHAAVGLLWPGLGGLGSAGFPTTFSFSGKASPSTRRFSHFVTSMTAPVASGWSVWPGAACTHWKAPPLHGAHVKRTLSRTIERRGSTLSERFDSRPLVGFPS